MYKVSKNNFDLIRLVLSLIVFITHAEFMTKHSFFHYVSNLFQMSSVLAVNSFFIVSGFLIFMSYENTKSIGIFLRKRFSRIYPGYSFVVLFVAVFAIFISNSSLSDYLSSGFIPYLVSNLLTLNFLHSTLPGVFVNNAIHEVNGALWTIKIELMFYLSVPIIIYFIRKSNVIIVIFIVYILSLIYHEYFTYYGLSENISLYLKLAKQLPGQLSFFVSGALLYYYFDHFKKYRILYIIAAGLLFIYGCGYDWKLYKDSILWIFYPIALAFVVIYFATMFTYLGNFGRYGDFSFGVYIWHVPIIQTFIHFDILSKYPIFGPIFLIMTVVAFSIVSWHFIEKPFLNKKSHYIKVEHND